MKFATLLKQEMASATMTQADLVRRSGIASGTISKYLSGAIIPSIEQVGRLAAALGCGPGRLVPMPQDTPQAGEGDVDRG